MKQLLFILFCVLFCASVQAQDTNKRWTLEECIQYAIDNNISIKQIELQKEDADIQLNTAKMSRLPNLNASFGQDWSFGRAQAESGLYENMTQSNSNLSINSSIPLFTGFRINNEIAKNQIELKVATENLERAKDDLSLNIASLFLQVLFDKELLKIKEEQLLLSLGEVEKTKKLVDAGKVPLSQLYDIESQVASDEVAVIQAKNTLDLSLLDLAQSLELERDISFDVYIPEFQNVLNEFIGSIQPPQVIYNSAVQTKAVIKEQKYKIESAEKSLKIAQAGYMPSLNLDLRYGTGYYYNYDKKNEISPITGNPYNPSFSDQFKNNAGESIGLTLSIPIFNRFSVRNQVRSAKINIWNQQLELDNTKKNLYKEIQTAYLNATASLEKYKAAEKAVKATSESFKYAQDRYEIGKSSVFEFNEARNRLVQSQSELIQAKYDYIFRAKILDFYNGVPIML